MPDLVAENICGLDADFLRIRFYDDFHDETLPDMKLASPVQSMKNAVQRRMVRLGISENDIEEHFSRASGPGGQNVNKVSTAVTVRHAPSNLSVCVQDSRSQAVNRQLARTRLLDAIEQAIRAKEDSRRAACEKQRRRSSPRPRALKRRILENKKRRAGIKKLRSRVEAAG